MESLVTLEEIRAARERIKSAARYTPLIDVPWPGSHAPENAQTLWLAARIENRLGNRNGVQDFGTQLRNRFPESREASSYLRGAFDE